MNASNINALRMERQWLTHQANEMEYLQLYRDLQPGRNVYWNGFGDPPSLSFRAAFDDIAYNKQRQLHRQLVKGRFGSGNLGWIVPEDIEVFAGLYQKPLKQPTEVQTTILRLLEHNGPLTIQQIKEESGLLVKEITPTLHRLQEAFLIYEDQFDGEWDRSWYLFTEMFPQLDCHRYTRMEALKVILPRFAYRMVVFDVGMVKSFYRLPEKEIRVALEELINEQICKETKDGFLLTSDLLVLDAYPMQANESHSFTTSVYAMHRNDVLVATQQQKLKEVFRPMYESLPYDHEPLQYLLIDGVFCGVVIGHFRNGPYDLEDVILNLNAINALERKEEILEAIAFVNGGRTPKRYMGVAQ